MANQMSAEEILALPAAVPLVVSGRALGMGRSGTYEAHARGDFPCRVIKAGRRLMVPRAEILKVLGMDEQAKQSA